MLSNYHIKQLLTGGKGTTDGAKNNPYIQYRQKYAGVKNPPPYRPIQRRIRDEADFIKQISKPLIRYGPTNADILNKSLPKKLTRKSEAEFIKKINQPVSKTGPTNQDILNRSLPKKTRTQKTEPKRKKPSKIRRKSRRQAQREENEVKSFIDGLINEVINTDDIQELVPEATIEEIMTIIDDIKNDNALSSVPPPPPPLLPLVNIPPPPPLIRASREIIDIDQPKKKKEKGKTIINNFYCNGKLLSSDVGSEETINPTRSRPIERLPPQQTFLSEEERQAQRDRMALRQPGVIQQEEIIEDPKKRFTREILEKQQEFERKKRERLDAIEQAKQDSRIGQGFRGGNHATRTMRDFYISKYCMMDSHPTSIMSMYKKAYCEQTPDQIFLNNLNQNIREQQENDVNEVFTDPILSEDVQMVPSTIPREQQEMMESVLNIIPEASNEEVKDIVDDMLQNPTSLLDQIKQGFKLKSVKRNLNTSANNDFLKSQLQNIRSNVQDENQDNNQEWDGMGYGGCNYCKKDIETASRMKNLMKVRTMYGF